MRLRKGELAAPRCPKHSNAAQKSHNFDRPHGLLGTAAPKVLDWCAAYRAACVGIDVARDGPVVSGARPSGGARLDREESAAVHASAFASTSLSVPSAKVAGAVRVVIPSVVAHPVTDSDFG